MAPSLGGLEASENSFGGEATTTLLESLTGLPSLQYLALSRNVKISKKEPEGALPSSSLPVAGVSSVNIEPLQEARSYVAGEEAEDDADFVRAETNEYDVFASPRDYQEPEPIPAPSFPMDRTRSTKRLPLQAAGEKRQIAVDKAMWASRAYGALRALLAHPLCALQTLQMSGGAEFAAPAELPLLLTQLEACPSLVKVVLCGHGGGSKAKTTLAFLAALKSTRKNMRFLDLRYNHFTLSAYRFAVDEWRRNCPKLEQLLLFGIDPRQGIESLDKATLEKTGLSAAQLGEASSLAEAAADLSTRNRILRRASDVAGVEVPIPVLRQPSGGRGVLPIG